MISSEVMEMAIKVVLLAIGFIMLIKSADLLVNGASSLAKKFSISEIAIGLTIVAFGTSAPELIVNILSATGGHNELELQLQLPVHWIDGLAGFLFAVLNAEDMVHLATSPHRDCFPV